MDSQTRSTLRQFRRLYHLAVEPYRAIAERGGLGFTMKYEEGALTASVNIPDEDEAVRFVVLMRRFLHPDAGLYYERIWELVQGIADPTVLSLSGAASIESFVARWRRGPFPLQFNGRPRTAARMYEEFSNAGFFADEEAARVAFQRFADAPGGGTLARFVFFNYSLEAFKLMDHLFGLLKRADAFAEASSASSPRCIYCLSSEGTFGSEEHIVPESLGNDEFVLPRGLVCDACNNGVLAGLDNALLRFEPIALSQVIYVPYTKGGRLPSANFQNLSLTKTGPRQLRLQAKDRTGDMKEVEELDDGLVRWKLEMRGRRFDPRLLGRAFCKMALGFVALEEGVEVACSARYDAARRFILRDDGFDNNLLLKQTVTSHGSFRATRDPRARGTVFGFDIYGLIVAVNLETEPTLEVTDQLASFDFVAYPLPRVAA